MEAAKATWKKIHDCHSHDHRTRCKIEARLILQLQGLCSTIQFAIQLVHLVSDSLCASLCLVEMVGLAIYIAIPGVQSGDSFPNFILQGIGIGEDEFKAGPFYLQKFISD